MTSADEVGDQLAAWGKVARLESRGRVTGRLVAAAVGFVEDADGSLVVAAGSPDADWVRNLDADPRCRVTIEGVAREMRASRLAGAASNAAVVALILKYGTPAERLGRGPTFRLAPATGDRRS